MSRRIVVDTSVARSAGTTDHPTSRNCRLFLESMLHICHKVVLSREIQLEWSRHQSLYTTRWLSAMRQRRKLVIVPDQSDLGMACLGIIQDLYEQGKVTGKQRSALDKDILLLVAADAADGLIASLDDTMRDLLGPVGTCSRRIASIVWVNPDAEEERAIDWLESGARSADRPNIKSWHDAKGS